MGQIPQAIIFNKKDLHDGSLPATNKPHVFVSSKDEKDIEKVKSLLFNQIKQVLTYYEESVPSANADRLYF